MGEPTSRLSPSVILDDEGQAIFVHDCDALCGDGRRRLIRQRHYVLGIPPWAITSRDPLTIEPSIDCGACPLHGFFRAGQWVAA